MNNSKKARNVRRKLREFGILPNYGDFLTDEQNLIWKQIKQGDFSFWEKFSTEHNITIPEPKEHHHDPEKLKTKKIKPHHCKCCGEEDPSKFYPNNKSTCIACVLVRSKIKFKNGGKEKQQAWMLRNFIHFKVQQAKHRAHGKGLEFTITDESIEEKLKEQNGRCFFTNVILTLKKQRWDSLSLDRLDNDKGYTNENVILVTRFVNNSKNTMTTGEFFDQIETAYLGIFGNPEIS